MNFLTVLSLALLIIGRLALVLINRVVNSGTLSIINGLAFLLI